MGHPEENRKSSRQPLVAETPALAPLTALFAPPLSACTADIAAADAPAASTTAKLAFRFHVAIGAQTPSSESQDRSHPYHDSPSAGVIDSNGFLNGVLGFRLCSLHHDSGNPHEAPIFFGPPLTRLRRDPGTSPSASQWKLVESEMWIRNSSASLLDGVTKHEPKPPSGLGLYAKSWQNAHTRWVASSPTSSTCGAR